MTPSSFPSSLFGITALSHAAIRAVLDLSSRYAEQNRSGQRPRERLAGRIIANMFFENSTRTRASFEIAAKRLGAEVVNFSASASSMSKGETFSDTVRVMGALGADALVIRHTEDNAAETASRLVDKPVLNAGNGTKEHPTQALLDALTMERHKGSLQGLHVAICGDIRHSRVAKSNALLLGKMGARTRFFAPEPFALDDDEVARLGVSVAPTMREALEGCDVVMMLRVQNERLKSGEHALPPTAYHEAYGLNHERLAWAKKDVIVMHPAPMNRGVEITSALADDPAHSVIFEQMELGVAVRMACLDLLLTQGSSL